MPSVDSGVFIAYILPGLIALWGLSHILPGLRDVFRSSDGKTQLGTAAVITVVAILLGIGLTIGRTVLIEPTFAHAVPILGHTGRPYLAAINAYEPDYAMLATKDQRERFQLAISNEQRPYQFSGNTALAVAVATFCWSIAQRRSSGAKWRLLVANVAAIAIIVTLYCSARMCYGRYMRAIATINASSAAAAE